MHRNARAQSSVMALEHFEPAEILHLERRPGHHDRDAGNDEDDGVRHAQPDVQQPVRPIAGGRAHAQQNVGGKQRAEQHDFGGQKQPDANFGVDTGRCPGGVLLYTVFP